MNDQIEYQELSADWRHRDTLTWQIPTFMGALIGFLVSKGFELIGHVQPLIVLAIFIFATGFAVCLTAALWQNLIIQKKDSRMMMSMYKSTERFNFKTIGSLLLLGLSVVLCACLIFLSLKYLTEPIEYWKPSGS